MKTLTTNQIKELDQLLITRYQLTYIDVRMEILDHIATDIENVLDITNYENAKQQTILKWDKQLFNKKLYKKGIPTEHLQRWRKEQVFRNLKALLISSIILVLFLSVINLLDLKKNILYNVYGVFYGLFLFSFSLWQLTNKGAFKITALHTAKAHFLKINQKMVNVFVGIMSLHLLITTVDQVRSLLFLTIFGFMIMIYIVDLFLTQRAFIQEQTYQSEWDRI